MTIQQTIQKAIEGGYKGGGREFLTADIESWRNQVLVFLDPLFWQALGKILGWEKQFGNYSEKETKRLLEKGALIPRWLYQWHRFIDHLAEGKSVESFFRELEK